MLKWAESTSFKASAEGSEWIISVGDYVDNSFSALGSSDPREARALARLYVFHFRFVQVHFFC